MTTTLHTQTALAVGLKALFSQLEQRMQLSAPLTVYLAGGMAVHLYTAERVTTDVDAEFSARLAIPADMLVELELEDGENATLYFDTNYSPMFGLLHEDYQQDALDVDLGLAMIRLKVLSPIDLAVSKLARYADNDKQDIQQLVKLGLVDADKMKQRANDALSAFVGGQAMVKFNIEEAVANARSIT